VDQRDMVVRADDVSEGREALFYPPDGYRVGQAVPQVLEFLVGGCGGDEETFLVAGCQAADYAGAGDGCVADWDDVLEFGFEDAVEIL